MDIQTTSVILIFLTLLVAGYAVYRLHTQGVVLTPTTVVNELKSAQPRAQELLNVANIVVQANEQRKREGKITNEQAYDDALNFMKKWFPGTSGVDNNDIINAVNAAILVASQITSEIKSTKEQIILP